MRYLLGVLLTVSTLGAGAQPAPAPKVPLDPFVDSQLKAFCAAWPGEWAVTFSNQGSIITISGHPKKQPGPPGFDIKSMRDKLARLHDSALTPPAPQFDDNADPRIIGNLRQFTYWQKVGDQRVDGAAITITVNTDGSLYHIALSQVPQIVPPAAVRPLASTLRVARAQYLADVASEAALQHRATVLDAAIGGGACPLVTTEAEGAGDSLNATGGKMRRVQLVVVTAAIQEGGGSTLLDKREYAIDATTTDETAASVVRVIHLLDFVSGTAKLFDPNPMRALGTLKVDPLDTAQLLPAYVPAPLNDLDPPQNNLVFLTGPRVRIVEAEGPDFCPLGTSPGFNTSLCLPNVAVKTATDPPDFTTFTRGTPEFAGAMAYFHLDRIQTYVAKLGFSVPVVSIDVAAAKVRGFGHFCNCTSPTCLDGCPHGFIGLGRDGSNYLAEDGTDIAHEYGHVLLAQGTNKVFGTARTAQNMSEALPIGEGLGDYWSFSTFYEASQGTQFENCFGEWGNGFDCERHYDALPNHSSFKESNDDHVNGMIWSGTLADLFRKVGGKRELADSIIVQGHYLAARLPDAPTMVNVADAIVFAARVHGVNTGDVCDVLKAHGIIPPLCSPTVTTICNSP
jgi:hypothetical protein